MTVVLDSELTKESVFAVDSIHLFDRILRPHILLLYGVQHFKRLLILLELNFGRFVSVDLSEMSALYYFGAHPVVIRHKDVQNRSHIGHRKVNFHGKVFGISIHALYPILQIEVVIYGLTDLSLSWSYLENESLLNISLIE